MRNVATELFRAFYKVTVEDMKSGKNDMTMLAIETNEDILSEYLLIPDTESVYTDYFSGIIETYLPCNHISKAKSFDDLLKELDRDKPTDLAFIDIDMPGPRGLYPILYLTQRYPAVRFVVLVGDNNPSLIERCMRLGAQAVITRKSDVQTMKLAITAIRNGLTWPVSPTSMDKDPLPERPYNTTILERFRTLTPREIFVYMHLCAGLEDKEIARELQIAPSTAKAHVASILAKLGVKNRTQAVIAAYQSGLEMPELGSKNTLSG